MNTQVWSDHIKRVSSWVIACGMGYACWSSVASMHYYTIEKSIPICFYNVPSGCQIDAPASIKVTLQGTRFRIKQCEQDERVACHINVQALGVGTHYIEPTSDRLFLPEQIKLVHYTQQPIVINVHKSLT